MTGPGRTELSRRAGEAESLRAEVDRLQGEVDRLAGEVERLGRELGRREREAAARASQLELYAADLRETFKQERARAQELTRSYRDTVRALANAVEARDAYTRRHAERVADYGTEVARALGLPEERMSELELGFLLHDIGKVAISDAILHKPGPLTGSERERMSRHVLVGEQIVAHIAFLEEAAKVVRSHHERWDGSGYPDGLAGEQIPEAARVFAVADVFDALTTDRPYRQAMAVGEARELISSLSGSHFDPRVVAAFEKIPDETLTRIQAAAG